MSEIVQMIFVFFIYTTISGLITLSIYAKLAKIGKYSSIFNNFAKCTFKP